MEKYKYLDEFNKKCHYNTFDISEYTHIELYIINKILSKNNLDNIIDTNNRNILYYIGLIYCYKFNKIEEAKLYLLKAIELNNNSAMGIYAEILIKENKVEEAKKYLLMAIKLNNSDAMNSYAILLKEENKLEEAKKYYLMAINLNNNNAMNNYGLILEEENKIEEAKLYYLKAIELNNIYAINNYKINYKNKIEQYNDLKNMTSKIAINYIKELEELNEIKYYKIADKKIDICYICYNENIEVISYKCNNNHYLCNICYTNIEKCPYCRL